MKKCVLLVGFVIAFFAQTFGQSTTTESTQPTTEKQRGRGKDKMKAQAQAAAKELNLSDEQKAKMRSIANSYQGKLKAIKTDNALSKEDKKTKMKEIMSAQDAEVKGVLSADQYTKWQEMKKNRQGKMKENLKN
jgi:periplasmic protein CpxP/Spy